MPVAIERFRWYGAFADRGWACAQFSRQADVQMWNEAGQVVFSIEGLRLEGGEAQHNPAEANGREHILHELRWEQSERSAETSPPFRPIGNRAGPPRPGRGIGNLGPQRRRRVRNPSRRSASAPAGLAGVVCLSALNALVEPSGEDVLRETEAALLRTLGIVHAVAAMHPPQRLWLVTRGAQSASPIQSSVGDSDASRRSNIPACAAP